MRNILLIPRAGAIVSTSANGRSYRIGATLVAPDFDAQVLGANGWLPVAPTGPSSARPKVPAPSEKFVDTDLGEMIVFDGAAWRDLTGAPV